MPTPRADVPMISVVMPAFNAADFVEVAVTSILEQTFTQWELVAVDDGSTDATRELLEGFSRADPRVRVVSARGKGIVAALATGLAEARADLIARMDADDIARPERLQRQFDHLRTHPHIGVLGATVQVIDEAGEPRSVIRYPLPDPVIRLTSRHDNPFAHGAVIMRREALQRVGGYDADSYPCEDYDLWCRMVADGVVAANLDDILYEHRTNPMGVSSTRADAQRRSARQVGRRYGRHAPPAPRWRELRAAIDHTTEEVAAARVDPRALRRLSASLQASAGPWCRTSPVRAVLCVRAALRAERAYRRLRR